MMIKHIGIIGVGGVGGYFGGKLTRILSVQPEVRLYFIARGQHLKEIQKNGLILSTSDEGEFICYPTLATDHVEDLPVLDVCLICVKSYDLADVLIQLKSVINRNTMILPLLNGVDIYERIRSVINEGVLFPGCVYVGTHIEKPGKVLQKGGACKILFGKDPHHPETIPHDLFSLLDLSRIKYAWMDDPYPEIWEKFIFIAAFGMVGAVTGKPLGQILEEEGPGQDVKSIMKEIVKVAKKQGILLRDTIVEESYQKAGQFPYEAKCSFHRDFEKDNKHDERDLLGGTILRLGTALNVDVSVTRLVYSRLKKLKSLNVKGKG